MSVFAFWQGTPSEVVVISEFKRVNFLSKDYQSMQKISIQCLEIGTNWLNINWLIGNKRKGFKAGVFSVPLVCEEELNLMLKVIGLLVKVQWALS